MIDVLFVAWNRLEFTKAAVEALLQNTDWEKHEARLILYDDGSEDGTREYLQGFAAECPDIELRLMGPREGRRVGPVAVMVDHIQRTDPQDENAPHIFAKIDSDTMVPPGWLDETHRVMRINPGLDFLGIEAMHAIDPRPSETRTFEPARHIGGIGLFRTRAFSHSLPRPNVRDGRFGFTEFQLNTPHLIKGWTVPALPVFLLDHLPRDPWQSLSREYVDRGWQRNCDLYAEGCKPMWSWWCE